MMACATPVKGGKGGRLFQLDELVRKGSPPQKSQLVVIGPLPPYDLDGGAELRLARGV